MWFRSLVLAFTLCSVPAFAGGQGPAPGSLQWRANRAYRAGSYVVACPLFEAVVAEQRFDAWAWNDLALCRVKLGDLAHVGDALDKAASLERAVGDAKLVPAISTNEGLWVKALLAAERWPAGAGLPAANLAVRRFDAGDHAGACPLFEHALATREVLYEPDEWRRISQCRLDTGQRVMAVLDALEHAWGSEQLDPVVRALAAREAPDGETWQARCRPLDGAACGRRWVLCATPPASVDDPYLRSTSTSYVVLEANTLAQWAHDPFAAATAQVFAGGEQTEELRCPGPKGREWLSPVGAGLTVDMVVTVDACAGVAVRWKLDARCESDGGAFSREPVSVTPLPPP
jgi:tetratricopeptide (TPR) repeat protein